MINSLSKKEFKEIYSKENFAKPYNWAKFSEGSLFRKLNFANFSKVPRLAVDAIIKSSDGVVLSLRAIEPCIGDWHIPGGTVYFDDGVRDAVKRVALEETGLNVEIVKFLGYIDYVRTEIALLGRRTVTLAFEVKPISGKLKCDFQSSDIRFFTKLPEKLISEQRKFLIKNRIL